MTTRRGICHPPMRVLYFGQPRDHRGAREMSKEIPL